MNQDSIIYFLNKSRLNFRRLTVFNSLTDDPVFQSLKSILDQLFAERPVPEELITGYHRLCGLLLEVAGSAPFPGGGDAWQDHLLNSLLLTENGFTRQVERLAPVEKTASLQQGAVNDLKILQELFQIKAAWIKQAIAVKLQDLNYVDIGLQNWPAWEETNPGLDPKNHAPAGKLKQVFRAAANWEELLDDLISYYRSSGTGRFGRYWAFRLEKINGSGELVGIAEPDQIRFNNLIGYEFQRQQIITNTEQFLKGFPANNLLLYGERGTGKSSIIKALVHEYGLLGLRVIEIAKQDISGFPFLLEQIRRRPQRFIIFIDDLSFEEHESDYKYLKAVLEGSLEVRPDNVLIYATSNRRHLIKERFSDRDFTAEEGEVRMQDTLQEKLSLADRFGITITFTSPDQEQYLEIVEGLAQQRNLQISLNLLREEALKWALWHNGRSGRTARQFIDDLTGKLLMEDGDDR